MPLSGSLRPVYCHSAARPFRSGGFTQSEGIQKMAIERNPDSELIVPKGSTIKPSDLELVNKHYLSVRNFRNLVCWNREVEQYCDDADWTDLSLGYFLGQHIETEEAIELARIVRYGYEYWTE